MTKKTNKPICGGCAWYSWMHARCKLRDDRMFYTPIDAVIRPFDTDASTCPDRLIPADKNPDKDYDA